VVHSLGTSSNSLLDGIKKFNEVVDDTALMVFGELSLLAAAAGELLEKDPNSDAQALALELSKTRKQHEGAAIRLALYQNRFGKPTKDTPHKVAAEFRDSAMSGGWTEVSGTAGSGLYASNLNG
jgi:hypothetical protein